MKYKIVPFLSLACLLGGSLAVLAQKGELKRDDVTIRMPKSSRWKVSWAVDDDAKAMKATPVPTTIAKLNTFKRPAVLPKVGKPAMQYRSHRVGAIEKTVWSVTGTIVAVAAEHDGDFRLIIADEKGNKICCVMPDPDLVPLKGPFTKALLKARHDTAHKFAPLSYEDRDVKVKATVSGIGYFGRMNPEENPSPEGFQLHPLTSVRFHE